VAICSPARAEGELEPAAAPLETAASRTRVEVNLVAALGRDETLAQLLHEWLATADLEPVLANPAHLSLDDIRAPRGIGPPVRLWLAAVSERLVRVYFAEPDSGRYLVRAIPLESGFDELGRERVAQIVLSSVLAFLEERSSSTLADVARSIEEPPEPAAAAGAGAASPAPTEPSRPVQARARSGPLVGAGVLYGVSGKGPEGTAHGPGATLELAVSRRRLAVGAFAEGQLRWPREVASSRVRLTIRDSVIALGVSSRLKLGAGVSWQAELGGGLQRVHVEPESRIDGLEPRGASGDTRPIVLAGCGPLLSRGELWLGIVARLEFQPMGVVYQISNRGRTESELIVPRLQPGLFARVGYRKALTRRPATR
jgi:hypothetical protein